MSNLASRITNDLMERTEQAYERVRRRFNIEWVGELPYHWLADTPHSVPSCNIGAAFTNPADAMQEVARLYREALLADADVQFEVWVEKDASDDYAPPIAGLYACRGFATLSWIHDWAATIFYFHVYHACGAADRIAETLSSLADEPILAQRLAVMPEQIAMWPAQISRYHVHRDRDLEFVDEYPPDDLFQIVRHAMKDHLPREEFEILKLTKESDRGMGLKWDPWKWRPG